MSTRITRIKLIVFNAFLGGVFRGKDFLKHAFSSWLVETESFINRRAHLDCAALAFVGPFGELNFRNEFGFNPMRTSRRFYLSEERTFVRLDLLQPFPEVGVRGGVEAAASVADMDQASF